MSLHIRLGVLFIGGADTTLMGTPEVLLGVARWILGPSLVLARSRGGILISRWWSDLMVLLGCGECLDLCGGYPQTFVVPMAWTDWKWVLRLMSLHVRLGVLFPGVADTTLRGTPEVLLRWHAGSWVLCWCLHGRVVGS